VNEVIENNRDRFNDNVDIIDIKLIRQTDTFLEAGILTKAQIGNASNIYLLSERGYAKLIKLFNDDKSWELYDNLLDEYFDLRDANVVQMNNQPTSQLQVLQLAINQMVQQEQELLEIKQKQLEQENKVIQLEYVLTKYFFILYSPPFLHKIIVLLEFILFLKQFVQYIQNPRLLHEPNSLLFLCNLLDGHTFCSSLYLHTIAIPFPSVSIHLYPIAEIENLLRY